MELEKKYGLATAVSMVIGIVIGSGVFFKSQSILELTKGNVLMGVLAFLIGGVVMLICALTFATLATKFGHINGLIDYGEAMLSKRYASIVGYFLATLYYPSVTGVLAWVTAHYTGVLFGFENNNLLVFIIGLLFLALIFVINLLAPKIAGKIQVSTTVIKLIPLFIMMFVGITYGLCEVSVKYFLVNNSVQTGTLGPFRILVENFNYNHEFSSKALFQSVVAVSFALDGYIVSASIVGELKNEKRNLPLALIIGSVLVVTIYIGYYLGLTGGALVPVLQTGGVKYAYFQIFGPFIGNIINLIIVISCIGTLNGMVFASTRAFYALSFKSERLKDSKFKKLNKENFPWVSSIIGIIIVLFWFIYFNLFNYKPDFLGFFSFDSSELPIVFMYLFYLPIFILMIVKLRKSLGVFKGLILPSLAIIASIFMLASGIYAHGIKTLAYLIVCIVVFLMGLPLFISKKEKKERVIDE